MAPPSARATPPIMRATPPIMRATPPSTRTTPTRGMRAAGGARLDERAQLHRKLADMQAELTGAQKRLERALHESAHADEMIGQMLARVADAEARMRVSQKQAAEAEARAADLATELARAREAQAALTERLGAMEARALGDPEEMERLCRALDAARTETTVALAAVEQTEEALAEERAQATALRNELAREHAELLREREERESLRARITELAHVCNERDDALAREELLQAELDTLRARIAAAPDGEAPVSALDDVRRALLDLERREADNAKDRAGILAAARNLVERALR
ncbi:Chromosome partition protein smc [Minicystis rosea]|nr:Chromosome partition protein smc [Minicystis rosea]